MRRLLRQQAHDGARLEARPKIVHGWPAEAILELAAAEHADLIAMATHGASGIARGAFGSTAEKVLRGAACPVLVRRIPGPGEPASTPPAASEHVEV